MVDEVDARVVGVEPGGHLAGGDEVQIGKFRLVYLTGPRTGEPAAR